jgi:hypothetical protein
LLEGLPGTPQPHRLPLAGTTFHLRQGPDLAQSLEALGPINASLIVMVTAGLWTKYWEGLSILLGWRLHETPPLAPSHVPRCWPGQSCLPSATVSTHPSPGMPCPPTPGTMHPGPNAQPSVQAVRPGGTRGGLLAPGSDSLGRLGLSGLLPSPRQPGAGRGVPKSAGQLSRGPSLLQRPQQTSQEAAGLQYRALPTRVSACQSRVG